MSTSQAQAGEKYTPIQRVVKLRAAAARTAGDIVRISTGHSDGVNADVALADDTNVYRVAVALEGIASGSVGLYAVEGTVRATVPSGNYTAGNGLDILDGAVRDSGAAAEAQTYQTTQNDFACILVGGTSVTEVTATLYGGPITAQT